MILQDSIVRFRRRLKAALASWTLPVARCWGFPTIHNVAVYRIRLRRWCAVQCVYDNFARSCDEVLV